MNGTGANLIGNLSSDIRIGNNSVYVNSSQTGLNKSANITLYTSDYSGQYPLLLRKLLRDGMECVGDGVSGSCANLTPMSALTFSFNVSDFGNGNISVGKFVRSKSEIPMTTGWNMISLTTENNETSEDVNVSLSAGWNLIGYSSDLNESTTNIDFTNSSGVKDNFVNSSRAGKLQRNVAYLSGSANAQKYSFVGKSGADAGLSKGKAYWVYANQAGNLTMKGVGGSRKNETYKLTDLMFRNGSGVEKNITDAVAEGWIGGGNLNQLVWYWDTESEDWANVLSTQSINTWNGYFVKGLRNNITMLRQD
jgi:hypothetical protein